MKVTVTQRDNGKWYVQLGTTTVGIHTARYKAEQQAAKLKEGE